MSVQINVSPTPKPYTVLMTGSHPEYHTGEMLDALEAYRDNGGRFIYLGGRMASIYKNEPEVFVADDALRAVVKHAFDVVMPIGGHAGQGNTARVGDCREHVRCCFPVDQAVFDIDNFEAFVPVQAEAAIRHMASLYAYDIGEDLAQNETTLRAGADEVAHALADELDARFEGAGIEVIDAKLTHLAYAPEIAQVMLRRQQAEAVVSARTRIVHGAVSMVEAALKGLSERGVVHLDDERKAAMVSNLLVVLCGDREAQPVVNTGTLYQ